MHTWVVVVSKRGRALPPSVTAGIDAPNPEDLTFPVGGHQRWSSDDGRVQAAGWWADDAPRLGPYWHVRRRDVTAYSGQVWIDAEPWRSNSSVVAQLADRCARLEQASEAARFDGVFNLLHLRADGSGWVTADPLGLGLVYRAETAEVVVVANRAELAAALVTPPGHRAARDVEAMGLLGFTGSMLGDRTGFDAVRVLPQASVLRLVPGGEPRTETWSPLPWWVEGPRQDPEAAIRHCLDRLRARVRLLASGTGAQVTCELSGGKDSRLVLALLLAEGLAHDVEYRTWGQPDLPDVTVATMLAEHFGLDHRVAGQPLVSRTGRVEERRRTSEGGAPTWKVRAVDFEEQVRHHVWAASGALSLWDLHTVSWPPSAGPALSGLSGEVLSTNYASTDRITTSGLLSRFLAYGGFGFDAARLLADDAAHHARAVVDAELRSLLPAGGDARDAVDGFYQRGRLRRWAGLQGEIGTRNRGLPLYDLGAARAAFAIGSSARRGELLHFRLIDACAPELARLPFADTGWSRAIVDGHAGGAGLPRRTEGRTWLPPAAEVGLYPARRRLQRSEIGLVSAVARRRRPRAGAAETNRLQDVDAKRAVLRSLLDLPAGHATWDLYDRRRTHAALDRLETLTTQGRAGVHHAATIATWLDGGERRADLFVPATR